MASIMSVTAAELFMTQYTCCLTASKGDSVNLVKNK